MKQKKKLLLVDVFGLMYKFYFTLPRMTAPDGTPTNAVFGLARVMLKLLRESKPDYLVSALESIGETFRHEQFSGYKAHRDRMPDDLRAQLPLMEELFEAMGLSAARAEGYEADDVIGAYSKAGEKAGLDVAIITGDRDLLQLAAPNVMVLLSRKGVTDLDAYTPARVEEEFGVKPEHIPDRKGLEGDSSDNIPGVKGIGKKTAEQLLREFKTLDGLYERLEKVGKERIRKLLEDGRDSAELSRRLATIRTDIEMDKKIEDFAFTGVRTEKLAEFLKRLDMRSLLKEIAEDAGAPSAAEGAGGEYAAVTDEKTLNELLNEAREKKRLCIDVETTGLDPHTCRIVGVSLAVEPGRAFYVPTGHEPDRAGKKPPRMLPLDRVLDLLRPVLEDPQIAKKGHNLKFDMSVLDAAGVRLRGVEFDSMIAAYISEPHKRRRALKPLAEQLLNLRLRTYKDLCGEGKNEIPFSMAPFDDAVQYACSDVDVVLKLEPLLIGELESKGLTRVFREIEMPLVPALARMEMNGVMIDVEHLRGISRKLARREDRIRADIERLTGVEINLNSPKQVGELLFDRLKLPRQRRDSTDVSVLEKLKDEHPAVPLIIEHRHTNKLRSTYVDALPEMINARTGRIHSSFNQTITATGRLSSSDPNLQNIPVRTEEGGDIRRAFVPPPGGFKILSADYSQVEIRLLAHLAGEPSLIEAFARGEDIHTRTASEIFGVKPGDVTPDMRWRAKTINFSLIYGKKEFGLSQDLGIPRKEAGEFIENYFARYPKLKDFEDETREHVVRDGYVTTIFGRRRYIPEAASGNAQQREFGFRAAVNARIQGTSADVIKLAMIRIHDEIENGRLDARMIMQVHDELVFEAPAKKLRAAAERVKELMETAADGYEKMSVPLSVDVSAGDNWRDCEPVF
ncbi:MAG: DNA polymerase I [bacterium]